MEDLYPKDSWRYVVGEADMNSRVGVFSFARFGPHFYLPPDAASSNQNQIGVNYEDPDLCPDDEEETYPTLLYRSCKVLAHEVIA